MEIELNVKSRFVILGIGLAATFVLVGILGATYTVFDGNRPLLLTWSRYELYRYQNRLAGWCRDLGKAESLAAEVFDRDDPNALVYGPALRSAWANLDDLERQVQDAPVEALALRDDLLAASRQMRDALTAAGVYVNRVTPETRLGLRSALDVARSSREALCPGD